MEAGFTGVGVTTFVWLLVTIMVVAVVSKYIRLPYTVALVIAGLVIALLPVERSVQLTPDFILLIFLPALLFESAFNLNFTDVRENMRAIGVLAVPGVILTALGIAAFMHYVVGVSWESAFLFGAIMSATDPVSVLAIFRQIGAPRRLSVVLEGESLFNDGTSLVIFRIVLGVVLAHEFSDLFTGIGQFVLVIAGAVALGALIGYGVSLILSRINDYLVETTMTVVVAYGTYVLSERVGVSGVIAVVVAGLVLGNYGRRTSFSASTHVAVSSTWEFFGFIANSLIFVLIGLELNSEKMMQFVVPTLLAIAAVLIVRALVVALASWILRYIHRPLPYRWQLVLAWGGLRGSLALAMALSIPLTLVPAQGGTTEPFPDRDLLQVMTFGVIIFSLLVQGLTMKPLLTRLGLVRQTEWQEEYEVISASKGMAAAAITELERMEGSGGLSPKTAKALKQHYTKRVDSMNDQLA